MVLQPVKEFKEKVKNCIRKLKDEKNALRQRVEKYEVISEKKFHEITSQIDCIFRKNLRDLFGTKNSPDKPWFSDEFLNFRSSKGKPSEELVFAFWGCDGSESYRKKKEPLPYLRENVYLRGTRWEDEDNRTKFYKNFRRIKRVFKNYVPVDFFGCLAKECPPILRITTVQGQLEDDIPTIVLPSRLDFVTKFPNGSQLHDFVKHIYECSKAKKIEIDVEKIEKLRDTRAQGEIGQSEFIKNLCIQFKAAGVKFSQKDDPQKEEIVFMVATSFQYYSWPFGSWPYDWYIIRPKSRNKKAVFALAVKKGNNKISSYRDCLQDLIEEGFSGYRKIEVDAWKLLSQDIHYYWMWKKEYENRKEIFEALCNAIKFIVQGICEKNKIKYKDVTHRVKEFDSFYEKLVEKVNEPSVKLEALPSGFDFPKNLKDKIRYDADADRKLLIFKGVMSEEEKNSLLKVSKDMHSYQKAVETLFKHSTKLNDIFISPQLSFDELMKERYVKDIAAIRVICHYKDDARRLWELMKKDCEDYKEKPKGKALYGLGEFDTPKEPSDEPGIFDYPRFHLWVKLAKKRVELPEYDDLRDIPCEVQIGTILEEGWADVNHEIIYKPGSFLLEGKIKELKKESLSELLPSIKRTDKGFVELRKRRKTEDFNYGGASGDSVKKGGKGV